MMELQKRIEGVNILKAKRLILKEGKLQKMCRKGPQDRVILLFSDMLMYAREQAIQTQYVGIKCISLEGMQVKAETLPDGLYGIVIQSKSRSFLLCTDKEKEQKQWVDSIADVVFNARKKRLETTPGRDRKPTTTGQFGEMAPVWTPDSNVSMCQTCFQEFSFVRRRRHHCRACGKVICAGCSSNTAPLLYLKNDHARVCNECYGIYIKRSKLNKLVASTSLQPKQSQKVEVPGRLKNTSVHDERFVVLSGFMMEVGKFRKKNKRWLVLRSDGVLFSYKGANDPVAAFSLPIPGYKIEEHAKKGDDVEYGFKIRREGARELTYICDDEETATKWTDGLRHCSQLELPSWFKGDIYCDDGMEVVNDTATKRMSKASSAPSDSSTA
eukprot:m.87841 g.87841  ORF g.87841 m.87841 type:complete len:384 (-) comp8791_c6_seq1:154-1305(-)